MMLGKDIELLDGLPIAFVKSLSSLVCADLHLGYEGVMADKGVFLPKANLKRIKDMLKAAANMTGAKSLVVDGDIKNEFSKVHLEEFNELLDFVNFVHTDLGMEKIILVKGNHDNFVDRLREPFNIAVYRQEALLGNYLFFHGEELPAARQNNISLIMGHLHPSIAIYSKLGIKEKLRCFLYGKIEDGRKILILPAMNYYAEGVDVNMSPVSEIAPIFKKMLDINKTSAYCIGEGETLEFGKVGELKKLF